MRSPLRRTVLLLAGLALLGAACRDGGSPTGAAPDDARVGFSLDVAGTSVTTIVVEVSAPDIASRPVFNIEAVDGVATGSITIPAGSNRTITARAYDARGNLTHEGSQVVTVKGGTNASITLTLLPVAGEQPLTINFGALVVQVSRVSPAAPGAPSPEMGDTVRYRAVIQNPDGSPVSGKVVWASGNVAVATVDSAGLVTARRPGQVEIGATYQGAGGSATLTVRGDGTDGTPDQTAPRATGFVLSADSVNIATGARFVDVTVAATDAGSGVSSMNVVFDGPVVGGSPIQGQDCFSGTPTPPQGAAGAVSLTCRIAFSPHAAAGTWSLDYVQLSDRAGNSREVAGSALLAGGARTRVKVVNPNQDVAAPAISAISIAPDSINLATGADTVVTVTVTASDPGAGVQSVTLAFRGETGNSEEHCFANDYALPSTTPTNQVTWSCRIAFPRASAAGTYRISGVATLDRIGNERHYTPEQVAAAGWEASFKVAK